MTKATSIVEYMGREAVKDNIADTLGKKTPQFIASVASLVNSNPAIAECEQQTILSSCLVASALDLPINQNLGFAYIIPYNNRNKGTKEAQFQMGYKGFIQLAMRSGQFKTINVTDVREGELKGNNRLTGELDFEWIEGNDRQSSKVVGFVAYMRLINGFEKQLYMTVEELTKHAGRYSQSFKRNSSSMNIWRDDFDVMAKKTVIKQLITKYAPMKIEMERAILADQAVIKGDQYQYPDNELIDVDAVAQEKERGRIVRHIKQSQTLDDLLRCEDAIAEQTQEVRELFENKKLELNSEADEVLEESTSMEEKIEKLEKKS